MNYEAFFNAIRGDVNLTEQNVRGTQVVVDYGRLHGTQVNKLAYIVATAWWESSQTMHPVREAFWMSESWRQKHLRYFPWYGRGLVQTTWRDNYIKVAKMIGVPADTFTDRPDLLLEWEYALPALFKGMETGVYTGKALDDYIDDIDEDDEEDFREYLAARRIVNGTDRAQTIAKLSLVFERGLKAGGYAPLPTNRPAGEPQDGQERPSEGNHTSAEETRSEGVWVALLRWVLSLLKNKR